MGIIWFTTASVQMKLSLGSLPKKQPYDPVNCYDFVIYAYWIERIMNAAMIFYFLGCVSKLHRLYWEGTKRYKIIPHRDERSSFKQWWG